MFKKSWFGVLIALFVLAAAALPAAEEADEETVDVAVAASADVAVETAEMREDVDERVQEMLDMPAGVFDLEYDDDGNLVRLKIKGEAEVSTKMRGSRGDRQAREKAQREAKAAFSKFLNEQVVTTELEGEMFTIREKDGAESASRRDARKIARVNAVKELSETVFGAWMEVVEADGTDYREAGESARFREWSAKLTREQVSGEFAGVEDAGSWLTADGELAMVSVLAKPALIWENAGSPAEVEIKDLEMEPEWEEAFRDRPQWWLGGAGVAKVGGGGAAVAVGAAKLKGEPLYDRMHAPMAAELDAKRNFLKFFAGFRSNTVATDLESITETFADGEESTRIVDLFRKISEEKAGGVVKNMVRVGSWKSEDGKILYLAFTLGLDDLE